MRESINNDIKNHYYHNKNNHYNNIWWVKIMDDEIDYSKIDNHSPLHFGFIERRERLIIDTKRLKDIHCDGSFPDSLFSNTSNRFFTPKYPKRSDWAIEQLKACINKLATEWNSEYKDAIQKIKTPKQAQDQTRLEVISTTCFGDDIEQVEEKALLSYAKRMKQYCEVIKSIHIHYLLKIFIDYFRTILLVIRQRGYKDKGNFTIEAFDKYVVSKTNKQNPLLELPHYKYFELLNAMCNFIKHNNRKAYNALANNQRSKNKDFLSNFVVSGKNKTIKYEGGMYSGDWLLINESFVDEILSNLQDFSKELCKLLYDEDAEEANWNSDESLIKILHDNYLDIDC